MPVNQLILEFDHTLFDNVRFKKELSRSLENLGVSIENFWQTYPQARSTEDGTATYKLERHIELLQLYTKTPKEEMLESMQRVLENSSAYLYSDTIEFLNRMLSLNINMTLLSFGSPDFQQAKVKASGVEWFFKDIHFTDQKRTDTLYSLFGAVQPRMFFLTSKLEEIGNVISLFPHVTPIIKRRSDIPLLTYRDAGHLNFEHLREVRDYLTIVHATSFS